MFRAITHRPRTPTRWEDVTHVRVLRQPDTAFALERWQALNAAADRDRLVPLAEALRILAPVRNLKSGRAASIRSDLRNWSNPSDHGNNSRDKGWIELGHLTKD
ncbi:MAG TPA: hypothetical protein VMQ93_20205 [Novosphingobium sp.]|nr:hypothetical protein [Novosphingobium sp.]